MPTPPPHLPHIPHLRIARPVNNLARSVELYRHGLGLTVLGSFQDHDGFDGVMLGQPGAGHHFEFTRSNTHPVPPTPTPEDLVVLYLPDAAEWQASCERMLAAGFQQVPSFNPYWDERGRSFADHDGYRVVLQNAGWLNAEPA
ncbi:VOC family protein [Ideonella sp.]|uniref:VOC family protein n=1 Tax=Ideonella sp. TaxID=1929293 RepID=UPI0035B43264